MNKNSMSKEYKRGYLEGQLDAAEGELWALRKILDQMVGQPNETDLILVRIRETEEFLKKHGRSIDIDD